MKAMQSAYMHFWGALVSLWIRSGLFQYFRGAKFNEQIQVINNYQYACDELIDRYEDTLQQISDYLQEHQKTFYVLENYSDWLEPGSEESIQIDTFSFFSIRDRLLEVRNDCKKLLTLNLPEHYISYDKEVRAVVKTTKTQLDELSNSSKKVEQMVQGFETKLMKMEELLSTSSLCN